MDNNPTLYTTQVVAEVIRTNLNPILDTAQIVTEVIRTNNDPEIILNSFFVQVLRPADPYVPPTNQVFICM